METPCRYLAKAMAFYIRYLYTMVLIFPPRYKSSLFPCLMDRSYLILF